MEEFFRQNYNLLTQLVIILAAVAGLYSYRKYKQTAVRYFIYFLCYVVILEWVARYPHYFKTYGKFDIIEGTIFEKNYWFYAIFWRICGTLFFLFYYRKVIKSKIYRSLLKYAGTLFLLSSAIYILIHWSAFFKSSLFFVKLFSTGVILLCVVLYFFEVLKTDKVLVFYKSLNFYISAAILIWWLIITPLMFFDIYSTTADWNFVILKWQIKLFANILMYLTFTFALLWCKPKNL